MGDCICDDIDLAEPKLACFRVGEPDLHYAKCPKYEPPLTMEELRLLRTAVLPDIAAMVEARIHRTWDGALTERA